MNNQNILIIVIASIIGISTFAIIPVSASDSLPSPHAQILQGISPTDIICNTEKVLVFRISNASPLCINVNSVVNAVSRGFIYPLSENPFGIDGTSAHVTKESSSLIHLTTQNEVQTYLDLSDTKIKISNILDGGAYYFGEGFDMMVEPEPSFAPSSAPSFESQTESSPSTRMGEISSGSQSTSKDYSTTNIQVKNVDEPDYVKNDGKHIFIANDYTVTIIDATSPKDAGIVEQFSVVLESNVRHYTENGIHDIFLNDDKLIIFLKQSGFTKIVIADISSRESAVLFKHFTVTGEYQSARMIDDYVYLVTSTDVESNIGVIIPGITHNDGGLDELSNLREEESAIFAFSSNTLPHYIYKTITSFDISGNDVNSESYLMGDGNTIYVSENSIYLTYVDTATNQIIDYLDWDFVDIVFPHLEPSDQYKIRKLLLEKTQTTLQEEAKWLRILDIISESLERLDYDKLQRLQDDFGIDFSNNTPQTIIKKIDIKNGKLNLVASTKVPGTVLNQFSMDEYDGQFRIATTGWDDRVGKSNSVNVFDIKNSALLLVGSLDEIAINEDIYSARFTGDTLYLVTFRQIDPFFVIDLSKDQPKILGELKIPGFSNYLHPFGDNHVIGIGRDGGVKIAMFDISDFENPKQSAQIFIGDHNTHTEAEENHKSILIDYKKQLLAIPITDYNNNSNFDKNESWYGFYVYRTNEQGFTSKGTVEVKNNEYYDGRTLYIDNTLYSISPDMISLNELDSLKEIQTIDLERSKFLHILSD